MGIIYNNHIIALKQKYFLSSLLLIYFLEGGRELVLKKYVISVQMS